MRIKIKKGQIYKNKLNSLQVEIGGKKDAKWLAKILTDKPGVYAGSHRLSEYTLKRGFELIV